MQSLPQDNPPLFVTGTDTGIGKTVVALLLMHYFHTIGANPFYLKPFQTGCSDPRSPESDAAFIYRHYSPLKHSDPTHSIVYCHASPKAPLFAARDQNALIDIDQVLSVIEDNRKSYRPLIIEGAGGLLVPIVEGILMIDLLSACHAKPILVARADLGTINHTLLSVAAMRQKGIQIQGILFVDTGKHRTPPDLIQENREAIENLSGIKVSGVIGHIDNLANPPDSCLSVFTHLFPSQAGDLKKSDPACELQ